MGLERAGSKGGMLQDSHWSDGVDSFHTRLFGDGKAILFLLRVIACAAE